MKFSRISNFFSAGIYRWAALALCIGMAGCNKATDCNCAGSPVATYKVSLIVAGPSGAPQGGVTLSLLNPPDQAGTFSTITDTAGKGTIEAPAGPQVIEAKIGTVFRATITVTVTATNDTSHVQVAGTVQLQQNTSLGKTLVIYAGCEQIERVLADTSIAYTTYDHTTVDSMRIRVDADSVASLTYLKQYAIVFSDCNCGDETNYPKLARLYGRYVQQGGKIYGGHYNYMNLQYIFAPYYKTSPVSSGRGDSLAIINTDLSTAMGHSVISWPSSLFNYTLFTDLPGSGTTTVYAVISGSTGSASSPQGIPIIIENRLGTGKYLWTTYHNQDILSDPRLVKIVRFFLYTM